MVRTVTAADLTLSNEELKAKVQGTDQDGDGVTAEEGDNDYDPAQGSKDKSPDADNDGVPWGPLDMDDQDGVAKPEPEKENVM